MDSMDSVKELFVQMHENIDAIHHTIAELADTKAHDEAMEQVEMERQKFIADMNAKTAAEAEARVQEEKELKEARDEEEKTIMEFRRLEDERRKKADEDRRKFREAQDDKRRKEEEERRLQWETTNREVNENLDAEITKLEEDIAKKMTTGHTFLEELQQKRLSINQDIENAIMTAKNFPTVPVRKRPNSIIRTREISGEPQNAPQQPPSNADAASDAEKKPNNDEAVKQSEEDVAQSSPPSIVEAGALEVPKEATSKDPLTPPMSDDGHMNRNITNVLPNISEIILPRRDSNRVTEQDNLKPPEPSANGELVQDKAIEKSAQSPRSPRIVQFDDQPQYFEDKSLKDTEIPPAPDDPLQVGSLGSLADPSSEPRPPAIDELKEEPVGDIPGPEANEEISKETDAHTEEPSHVTLENTEDSQVDEAALDPPPPTIDDGTKEDHIEAKQASEPEGETSREIENHVGEEPHQLIPRDLDESPGEPSATIPAPEYDGEEKTVEPIIAPEASEQRVPAQTESPEEPSQETFTDLQNANVDPSISADDKTDHDAPASGVTLELSREGSEDLPSDPPAPAIEPILAHEDQVIEDKPLQDISKEFESSHEESYALQEDPEHNILVPEATEKSPLGVSGESPPDSAAPEELNKVPEDPTDSRQESVIPSSEETGHSAPALEDNQEAPRDITETLPPPPPIILETTPIPQVSAIEEKTPEPAPTVVEEPKAEPEKPRGGLLGRFFGRARATSSVKTLSPSSSKGSLRSEYNAPALSAPVEVAEPAEPELVIRDLDAEMKAKKIEADVKPMESGVETAAALDVSEKQEDALDPLRNKSIESVEPAEPELQIRDLDAEMKAEELQADVIPLAEDVNEMAGINAPLDTSEKQEDALNSTLKDTVESAEPELQIRDLDAESRAKQMEVDIQSAEREDESPLTLDKSEKPEEAPLVAEDVQGSSETLQQESADSAEPELPIRDLDAELKYQIAEPDTQAAELEPEIHATIAPLDASEAFEENVQHQDDVQDLSDPTQNDLTPVESTEPEVQIRDLDAEMEEKALEAEVQSIEFDSDIRPKDLDADSHANEPAELHSNETSDDGIQPRDHDGEPQPKESSQSVEIELQIRDLNAEIKDKAAESDMQPGFLDKDIEHEMIAAEVQPQDLDMEVQPKTLDSEMQPRDLDAMTQSKDTDPLEPEFQVRDLDAENKAKRINSNSLVAAEPELHMRNLDIETPHNQLNDIHEELPIKNLDTVVLSEVPEEPSKELDDAAEASILSEEPESQAQDLDTMQPDNPAETTHDIEASKEGIYIDESETQIQSMSIEESPELQIKNLDSLEPRVEPEFSVMNSDSNESETSDQVLDSPEPAEIELQLKDLDAVEVHHDDLGKDAELESESLIIPEPEMLVNNEDVVPESTPKNVEVLEAVVMVPEEELLPKNLDISEVEPIEKDENVSLESAPMSIEVLQSTEEASEEELHVRDLDSELQSKDSTVPEAESVDKDVDVSPELEPENIEVLGSAEKGEDTSPEPLPENDIPGSAEDDNESTPASSSQNFEVEEPSQKVPEEELQATDLDAVVQPTESALEAEEQVKHLNGVDQSAESELYIRDLDAKLHSHDQGFDLRLENVDSTKPTKGILDESSIAEESMEPDGQVKNLDLDIDIHSNDESSNLGSKNVHAVEPSEDIMEESDSASKSVELDEQAKGLTTEPESNSSDMMSKLLADTSQQGENDIVSDELENLNMDDDDSKIGSPNVTEEISELEKEQPQFSDAVTGSNDIDVRDVTHDTLPDNALAKLDTMEPEVEQTGEEAPAADSHTTMETNDLESDHNAEHNDTNLPAEELNTDSHEKSHKDTTHEREESDAEHEVPSSATPETIAIIEESAIHHDREGDDEKDVETSSQIFTPLQEPSQPAVAEEPVETEEQNVVTEPVAEDEPTAFEEQATTAAEEHAATEKLSVVDKELMPDSGESTDIEQSHQHEETGSDDLVKDEIIEPHENSTESTETKNIEPTALGEASLQPSEYLEPLPVDVELSVTPDDSTVASATQESHSALDAEADHSREIETPLEQSTENQIIHENDYLAEQPQSDNKSEDLVEHEPEPLEGNLSAEMLAPPRQQYSGDNDQIMMDAQDSAQIPSSPQIHENSEVQSNNSASDMAIVRDFEEENPASTELPEKPNDLLEEDESGSFNPTPAESEPSRNSSVTAASDELISSLESEKPEIESKASADQPITGPESVAVFTASSDISVLHSHQVVSQESSLNEQDEHESIPKNLDTDTEVTTSSDHSISRPTFESLATISFDEQEATAKSLDIVHENDLWWQRNKDGSEVRHSDAGDDISSNINFDDIQSSSSLHDHGEEHAESENPESEPTEAEHMHDQDLDGLKVENGLHDTESDEHVQHSDLEGSDILESSESVDGLSNISEETEQNESFDAAAVEQAHPKEVLETPNKIENPSHDNLEAAIENSSRDLGHTSKVVEDLEHVELTSKIADPESIDQNATTIPVVSPTNSNQLNIDESEVISSQSPEASSTPQASDLAHSNHEELVSRVKEPSINADTKSEISETSHRAQVPLHNAENDDHDSPSPLAKEADDSMNILDTEHDRPRDKEISNSELKLPGTSDQEQKYHPQGVVVPVIAASFEALEYQHGNTEPGYIVKPGVTTPSEFQVEPEKPADIDFSVSTEKSNQPNGHGENNTSLPGSPLNPHDHSAEHVNNASDITQNPEQSFTEHGGPQINQGLENIEASHDNDAHEPSHESREIPIEEPAATIQEKSHEGSENEVSLDVTSEAEDSYLHDHSLEILDTESAPDEHVNEQHFAAEKHSEALMQVVSEGQVEQAVPASSKMYLSDVEDESCSEHDSPVRNESHARLTPQQEIHPQVPSQEETDGQDDQIHSDQIQDDHVSVSHPPATATHTDSFDVQGEEQFLDHEDEFHVEDSDEHESDEDQAGHAEYYNTSGAVHVSTIDPIPEEHEHEVGDYNDIVEDYANPNQPLEESHLRYDDFEHDNNSGILESYSTPFPRGQEGYTQDSHPTHPVDSSALFDEHVDYSNEYSSPAHHSTPEHRRRPSHGSLVSEQMSTSDDDSEDEADLKSFAEKFHPAGYDRPTSWMGRSSPPDNNGFSARTGYEGFEMQGDHRHSNLQVVEPSTDSDSEGEAEVPEHLPLDPAYGNFHSPLGRGRSDEEVERTNPPRDISPAAYGGLGFPLEYGQPPTQGQPRFLRASPNISRSQSPGAYSPNIHDGFESHGLPLTQDDHASDSELELDGLAHASVGSGYGGFEIPADHGPSPSPMHLEPAFDHVSYNSRARAPVPLETGYGGFQTPADFERSIHAEPEAARSLFSGSNTPGHDNSQFHEEPSIHSAHGDVNVQNHQESENHSDRSVPGSPVDQHASPFEYDERKTTAGNSIEELDASNTSREFRNPSDSQQTRHSSHLDTSSTTTFQPLQYGATPNPPPIESPNEDLGNLEELPGGGRRSVKFDELTFNEPTERGLQRQTTGYPEPPSFDDNDDSEPTTPSDSSEEHNEAQYDDNTPIIRSSWHASRPSQEAALPIQDSYATPKTPPQVIPIPPKSPHRISSAFVLQAPPKSPLRASQNASSSQSVHRDETSQTPPTGLPTSDSFALPLSRNPISLSPSNLLRTPQRGFSQHRLEKALEAERPQGLDSVKSTTRTLSESLSMKTPEFYDPQRDVHFPGSGKFQSPRPSIEKRPVTPVTNPIGLRSASGSLRSNNGVPAPSESPNVGRKPSSIFQRARAMFESPQASSPSQSIQSSRIQHGEADNMIMPRSLDGDRRPLSPPHTMITPPRRSIEKRPSAIHNSPGLENSIYNPNNPYGVQSRPSLRGSFNSNPFIANNRNEKANLDEARPNSRTDSLADENAPFLMRNNSSGRMM